MTDDMNLLRQYAEGNSEEAFAALVSRHVSLVYSVALRRVGNAHLAEEITQTVFITLARKAPTLSAKVILSGWLCRAARYAASNALTIQRRREHREQEAHMQSMLDDPQKDAWTKILPLLEGAMEELGEKDHDAIVLRFFEGKDLKQVGAALGTGEDAAKMRVHRALEKLRSFLARRGVNVSAGVLSGAVSANAIQAAPVGLAANISTATAALLGTAITSTTTATAIKTLAMTTIHKALITATIVASLGTAVYQATQASRLRLQHQTLQQQHAQEVQDLQQERTRMANELASLADQSLQSKSNGAELLRLRSEIGGLRRQKDEMAALQAENRSLRQGQTGASKTPAAQQDEGPTHITKDSWAFSGYATPEATLQTVLWAQIHGDMNTFLAGLAPEAQDELKSALERKGQTAAASITSAVQKVKGITILKKVPLTEDQILLRVRNEMEDGTEKFTTTTLKRIEGEWKVQSGRAE